MTDGKNPGHKMGAMFAQTLSPAMFVGQVTEVAPVPVKAAQHALTLEGVYRDHYEFVWRSVRRLGLPDGQVDDAVQDVFLVVYRRLKDFEGRSSVKTWLFGIAMRVVKDHRRKAYRLAKRHDNAPVPEPTQTPDQQVQQRQAVSLVDALLEQLDDDKRAVFIMAEIENLTAPEISETLGIKLNTVYSRLRLARRRFEKALERHRLREERRSTWKN